MFELDSCHLDITLKNYLYHFGLTNRDSLHERFGDVKFVCMGGKRNRMLEFSEMLKTRLRRDLPRKEVPSLQNLAESSHKEHEFTIGGKDLTGPSDRYALYKNKENRRVVIVLKGELFGTKLYDVVMTSQCKYVSSRRFIDQVGPCLVASHGVGGASVSAVVHELLKLCHYAKCDNVKFFRLGTSSGLGVEPGTVVLTDKAYNEELEPKLKMVACGKTFEFDAVADHRLTRAIYACSVSLNMGVRIGNTLSAGGFYEEQGRVDGALCCVTVQQGKQFLRKAHNKCNVVNVDMESLQMVALCGRAGMPCAVVSSVIVNRFATDVFTENAQLLNSYDQNAMELLAEFIAKTIRLSTENNRSRVPI